MITKKYTKLYYILLFSISYIFSSYPENSSALPQNRVKNIDFNRQDAVETAIILTEDFTRTTYFVLHDPERVVLDIHKAFIPQVTDSIEVKADIISGIRINQNQKDLVRVVVDINENTPYDFEIKKEYINENPGIKILLSSTPKFEYRKVEQDSIDNSIESLSVSESESSVKTIVLLDDTLPDDIFEDSGLQKEAPSFSFSGEIQARGTVQLKEDEAVENNQTFRNRLFLEGKYKKQITISALSDYLYFSSENKADDYDIDLYEAKWEHTDKKYGFSFGKQIVRWGKTDQISPIDTLNPEDFREFILPDYEERKIPIWMANVRLFLNIFTLEGVYIPFFEESKVDYFGTNWSVFGHLKKELQSNNLTPALDTYIENLAVHETDPENESEFAFRLQTTVKEIDLGFTFHHMIEDIPHFSSFPVKNISVKGDFSGNNLNSILSSAVLTNEAIEVEYMKTKAAGFEFETTLKNFGVRGETVWKENESFLTAALTSSRHPTLTSIVGADYTTIGNTYINVQFMYSHIHEFSPEILYFEKDSYSLLGEFRLDLISDWLQGGVEYNVSLNNDSYYFSPYLKYTYITNLECIGGTGLFYGDRETWFGRFKDYDLFFLDVSYLF